MRQKPEEGTIAKTAGFLYFPYLQSTSMHPRLFTKQSNASHSNASNPDASQS